MAKAKTLKDKDGAIVYPVTKAAITYLSDNTTNVETALAGKEPTVAEGTSTQYYRGDKTWQTLNKAAVGLANVDNTSDADKKTAFTGSISDGNTGFVTGGDVYDAITPIDTAINEAYMKDLALKAGTSTTVVELTKAFKNIKTGAATSADFALPVASVSQAGVVNAATYQTIQDTADKMDAVMGGSVAITGLPANPTQEQLTAAWKEETGKTELFNQAGIFDTANGKIWTYFENDETWHFVNAGEAKVVQWGTGVAGIVTGAADAEGNEGKIFAETDGTGSVIGWDALSTAVSNNTNNIANLTTSKQDVITAGTTAQYYRGDKTWQTLDKTAVGLANVDDTSDATKKTNFTAASIAAGETGFATGAMVRAELDGYVSFFATNPAIEDITA